MSWTANNYVPELELSIKADISGDLVSSNDSSISPWYSKDCRYIRRCTSIQRISYSAYEAMAKDLSQSNEVITMFLIS